MFTACKKKLPIDYVLRVFVPQCPFHGVIIPRDAQGQPSRAEDRVREELEEMRRRKMHPGKWEGKHSTGTLNTPAAFFSCSLSN